MKVHLILVTALIAFLLIPNNGQAKTDPWAHVTARASQVTDAVESGDHQAALTFLKAFQKEWNGIQKNPDVHINDLQIYALNASLDNLQKDLQTDADAVKLKRASTEFRLAEDALSSEGTPIWLSMGSQLVTALNVVQKDVANKNDLKFQVDLNHFLDLYQMVYPAMTIDTAPNVVKGMEEHVLNLSNGRMTYIQDHSKSMTDLTALRSDLKDVFQQPTQDVNALPSGSIKDLVMTLFGLILLTLFYVSWRKYRGTVSPSN